MVAAAGLMVNNRVVYRKMSEVLPTPCDPRSTTLASRPSRSPISGVTAESVNVRGKLGDDSVAKARFWVLLRRGKWALERERMRESAESPAIIRRDEAWIAV